MKRIVAAGLLVLSLAVAAPAQADPPRNHRCTKVIVLLDDGTHETVRICARLK